MLKKSKKLNNKKSSKIIFNFPYCKESKELNNYKVESINMISKIKTIQILTKS